MQRSHDFRIHGVSVRLQGDHPGILEQTRQELRLFSSPPDPAPRIRVSVFQKSGVHADETLIIAAKRNPANEIYWLRDDVASILNIPERTVTLCVSNSCPEDAGAVALFGTIGFLVHLDLSLGGGLAAFHGASLCKDGKGILLVGKTGSGKTSLSYFMTRSGFTYLSEEDSFIRMRPEGVFEILPYPRRIRISPHVMSEHPELAALPYPKELVMSLDGEIYRIDPRNGVPPVAQLAHIVYLDNHISHISSSLQVMDKASALFALLSSLEAAKTHESPKSVEEQLRVHNRTAFKVAKSVVDSLTVRHVKYNIIKDFRYLPWIISEIFEAC